MTRHYSSNDFFRRTSNTLLARYFHGKGLFQDLDFEAMKETKPSALFKAWLALHDDVRGPIDNELREIFDMSCKKGFKAILDEFQWQLRKEPEQYTAYVDILSALPGHYHRAMLVFLDYRICWRGATRFYHADTLTYWRKRKNMGHQPAAVDDASTRYLADWIRHYFHYTEGRGNHCIVESFRRGELDYFFAFPEDYSQESIEWVHGEFDRRPHNPAFRVVFVYSQKAGTLDLNFRGSYKAVEPLQTMFAEAILKLEKLPNDPKDERVYDLNLMREKHFDFHYLPGSGIEKVVIKKVRISSRITKGTRITLEADPSDNPTSIHDLLATDCRSIPLHLYNVTQVEITATMRVDANQPTKTETFCLTHPNSCSLKYDGQHLILRRMLEDSGIEPMIQSDLERRNPKAFDFNAVNHLEMERNFFGLTPVQQQSHDARSTPD